jgi:hypothetical protein
MFIILIDKWRIMNKRIITTVLILTNLFAFAQDPQTYASLIDQKLLKENLAIISSDALEGRLTGSRGQKMAAAFIADHFQREGLTPVNNGSFYQPFNLYSYVQDEISIKTKSASFTKSADVVFYGSADSGGEKEYEVVFAGLGTNEELAQISVRDRVVLLLMPEISFAKIGPLVSKLTALGAVSIMLYATVPDQEYRTFMDEIQGTLTNGRMSLQRAQASEPQLFFVSKAVVESLFGNFEKLKPVFTGKKNGLKRIKPAKASFNQKITEDIVKTENVMGLLEGTDKKDEVLVITAHYDHIGISASEGDSVNNGADDDGSGTVMVLQLATAFAKAKKDGHGPRRSILFMTVTAEELGLYGSEYYTDAQPVIPLAQTVVDLNIDMIGRWDAEHTGKAPYVYVIGADKLSSELHEINVRNNEKYTKLEFDYTYNDVNHPTNLYQRSDHWNFAKHGIPVIFFFDGIHEDYHKVSDEIGRIDFDILAKRGQVVFYTAWEIANREERLKVD